MNYVVNCLTNTHLWPCARSNLVGKMTIFCSWLFITKQHQPQSLERPRNRHWPWSHQSRWKVRAIRNIRYPNPCPRWNGRDVAKTSVGGSWWWILCLEAWPTHSAGGQGETTKLFLGGGWTNPSEKFKLDHFPKVRGENKKYYYYV